MMARVSRSASVGAAAGIAATLAHTAVMLSGHTYSRRARREPTPPRQITVNTARRTLPDTTLTERRMTVGTAALHFGYGSLAGAAYAALTPDPHARPVLQGTGYGLSVWAISYLGWLPALRIPPPATRQPPEQNLTMLLAHIAFGATLGGTTARLMREAV